ncbi:MAG: hypothetical protein P8J68_00430 [Arenicellaceae bacterium]|nr:hypothetical protein [Arenicellaceae bacterium]
MIGLLLSASTQAETFDIYNTLGTEQQRPLDERLEVFECEDTVYTVIKMSDISLGMHELEVNWFDPSQSKREVTRYDFTVVSGQERIWAWLRLRRASGTGMMKWLDSSAGLEEFIGVWLVEVKVDGRDIGQTSFRVFC